MCKDLLFALALTFCLTTHVIACTGIKLAAKNGSIVHGRTLEFGIDLDTSIVVVPRRLTFSGTTPLGPGMAYTTKYGALGIIAFNRLSIIDGMNEKGLCVGTFHFPGYAGYAEIGADNQSLALSPLEFPQWILTQFATVEEVREALSNILIAPTLLQEWGSAPPACHYLVFDRKGKCLVIEPINGQLAVYDNKLGILTNAPAFNWHMAHLRNRAQLNSASTKPVKLNELDSTFFSQPLHNMALPGDFTPASRFIRAALFSAHAARSENSDAAVYQAFHILNHFDIPLGMIHEEKNGKSHSEYTAMTCVRDPQTLKYYFKTYDDHSIRVIDLNQFNLDEPSIKRIRTIETNQPLPAADISSELE